MTSIATLSKELRLRTEEQGASYTDLSEKAGISRVTLRAVFGGKDDYRLSTLLAVANRLGLEVVLVPKSVARGLANASASAPASGTDRNDGRHTVASRNLPSVPSLLDVQLGERPLLPTSPGASKPDRKASKSRK